MNKTKPFYLSKTYIANFIVAFIFLVPEKYKGFVLSPEVQTLTFALINFILRAITKDKITLT